MNCCQKLIEKSYRFILGDKDYENYQAEKAKFRLAKHREKVLNALKTLTNCNTAAIVAEGRIRDRVQFLKDEEFRAALANLAEIQLIELKLTTEVGLTVQLTEKGFAYQS